MTYPAKHISQSIHCQPDEVYAYIANPENLPHWAAGLSQSEMKHVNGEWLADSPMGQVKVNFEPVNSYGIADHAVTLPSGEVVNNPLRVIPNGKGSEVVFTLYQRTGMSTADFENDAAHVAADLKTLKALLEAQTP